MDINDLLPVSVGQLVNTVDMLDAGVGQGDVDATPLVGHRLEAVVGFVGRIHDQGHGVPPPDGVSRQWRLAGQVAIATGTFPGRVRQWRDQCRGLRR